MYMCCKPNFFTKFFTMNTRSKANKKSTIVINKKNSIAERKHKLSTAESPDKSNKKITDKDVSKYFVTEIQEPNEKVIKRERKPIKIEIKQDNESKEIENSCEKNQLKQWAPYNWEKTFDLIREMRKYHTAPVDNQGCDKCSDKDADPKVTRFQVLVSLMLSSQTKDQINFAAMERLKKHGCTPQILLNTSDTTLGELIYPVGFWKRKVQYIKKVAAILLKQYDGDIPSTIEDLCALPGVGPKMGHLCMQVAWNKVTGIGVDTHVHRICNRLEWVKTSTKTPEDTRKQLELWLPKDLWPEINHLLVGFGQVICLPVRPKCQECLNKNFCPFFKKTNIKVT
ncbi:endonuclease III-like protein 1 [Chelonus insularis]|uniref:endonuclease III-like protein 1 n=1 Tax=Chelonus insularis TaxID=460826 RepID=UPI0015897892|nr:endonuclease III-like protein 1 [Chelonus insularis]